jgi:hypothetical protein
MAVTYYLANIISRLQMTKDPKPAGLNSTVTPKIVEPSAGFGFIFCYTRGIKQQEDSANMDDGRLSLRLLPRVECLRNNMRPR